MSTPDSGPLAKVKAQDILDWARAQPADAVIGVCRNPRACLIASYALHVLDVVISVGPGITMQGTYRFPDTTHDFDLPSDLNRLALHFDRLSAGLDESARLMCPADLARLEGVSP